MNPIPAPRVATSAYRLHLAARRLKAGATTLLSLTIVAGAAYGDSASLKWADGASRDHAYQRILVVGVAKDENRRCEFEEFMASQLTGDTTQVIQSCDMATPVTPPTRDSIAKAVAATGADAVLATYLVTRQEQKQLGGSADTRGGDYFKAEGDALVTGPVGFYDLPVVYGQDEYFAPVDVVEGKLGLASKLYATQGPKLVCTVDTVVKGVDATDVAIGRIAAAIGDKLRKEGLVR